MFNYTVEGKGFCSFEKAIAYTAKHNIDATKVLDIFGNSVLSEWSVSVLLEN